VCDVRAALAPAARAEALSQLLVRSMSFTLQDGAAAAPGSPGGETLGARLAAAAPLLPLQRSGLGMTPRASAPLSPLGSLSELHPMAMEQAPAEEVAVAVPPQQAPAVVPLPHPAAALAVPPAAAPFAPPAALFAAPAALFAAPLPPPPALPPVVVAPPAARRAAAPAPAPPVVAAAPHAHSTRRSAAAARAVAATVSTARVPASASAASAPAAPPGDAAAAPQAGPSCGGAPHSRTGFVFDERMTLHAPPPGTKHFEQPGRLRAIFARLHREGVLASCRWLTPRVAEDAELLACHTAAHVAAVDAAVDDASARMDDADMYASGGTPLAARLAAGCVTEAVLCVPAPPVPCVCVSAFFLRSADLCYSCTVHCQAGDGGRRQQRVRARAPAGPPRGLLHRHGCATDAFCKATIPITHRR
jgi:hypothetical protein